MKKLLIRYLLIVFTSAFIGCDSDEKIENYKSHEILIVTLEIEDDTAIEKVTLQSSHGQFTDSILQNEIGNNKSIKLKCPQKGEGTFSICVFTKEDTLCSEESYAEGGYRPKLKLKDNKFETLEWF
ncbi:MAG: hypothetical protein IPM38_19470 [Ignavibacteria bacterium]|nr:hypothetical protein [Ignavibacteria bacterium]